MPLPPPNVIIVSLLLAGGTFFLARTVGKLGESGVARRAAYAESVKQARASGNKQLPKYKPGGFIEEHTRLTQALVVLGGIVLLLLYLMIRYSGKFAPVTDLDNDPRVGAAILNAAAAAQGTTVPPGMTTDTAFEFTPQCYAALAPSLFTMKPQPQADGNAAVWPPNADPRPDGMDTTAGTPVPANACVPYYDSANGEMVFLSNQNLQDASCICNSADEAACTAQCQATCASSHWWCADGNGGVDQTCLSACNAQCLPSSGGGSQTSPTQSSFMANAVSNCMAAANAAGHSPAFSAAICSAVVLASTPNASGPNYGLQSLPSSPTVAVGTYTFDQWKAAAQTATTATC